jgi:hypothetical protein
MLLIKPAIVFEQFLGLNMASMIANATDKRRRRSIDNELKGRRMMSDKMRAEIKGEVIDFMLGMTGTEQPYQDSINDLFGKMDDDTSWRYMWSGILESTERGFLLPYEVKGNLPEGARLLPAASIEELCSTEEVHMKLRDLIREDKHADASKLILDSWEAIPLLHRGQFKQEEMARILSKEVLPRFCMATQMSSIMYLLSIVDLSLSHGGDMATAKSGFTDLLPRRVEGSWQYPIRAWIDGVRQDLGDDGLNRLGRAYAMSAGIESRSGIREVMRWRSDGHTPSWETARHFCDELGDEYTDPWLKHYVRYGAAHLLQEFHKFFIKNLSSDKEGDQLFLEKIYAEYNSWYEYHKELNMKLPA